MKEIKTSNGCIIREYTTKEEMETRLIEHFGNKFYYLLEHNSYEGIFEKGDCNGTLIERIVGVCDSNGENETFYFYGKANANGFFFYEELENTNYRHFYWRSFASTSWNSKNEEKQKAFNEYYSQRRDDELIEDVLDKVAVGNYIYRIDEKKLTLDKLVIKSIELDASDEFCVRISFTNYEYRFFIRKCENGNFHFFTYGSDSAIFSTEEKAKEALVKLAKYKKDEKEKEMKTLMKRVEELTSLIAKYEVVANVEIN